MNVCKKRSQLLVLIPLPRKDRAPRVWAEGAEGEEGEESGGFQPEHASASPGSWLRHATGPPPELLIREVWGRTEEFAFLTSFQVMLIMLA